MGKGDKKTRRGKIVAGTYGVRRKKKIKRKTASFTAAASPKKEAAEIVEEKISAPEIKEEPVAEVIEKSEVAEAKSGKAETAKEVVEEVKATEEKKKKTTAKKTKTEAKADEEKAPAEEKKKKTVSKKAAEKDKEKEDTKDAE
ncbi:MAG: 30S ribosomal protein THX [Bacteroidales bacterium]